MKKLMFGILSMVAVFAMSSGSPPAAAEPSAPSIGACRWFCGSGPSFRTEAQCRAACSSECEQIC